MTLKTVFYLEQIRLWPQDGRHILAHFNDEAIVVYQAYNPAIGLFAAKHNYFGGTFSYSRMSWIKPNFLWMMYRSGWGTKPNQEVTLAVWLRREFFETVLGAAVPSSYDRALYETREEWKAAVAQSDVRLQWDPDHDPAGTKVPRRAIQLGLRGEILRAYGRDAIVEIKDISDFVAKQREHARRSAHRMLMIPEEHVYAPRQEHIRERLGLESV